MLGDRRHDVVRARRVFRRRRLRGRAGSAGPAGRWSRRLPRAAASLVRGASSSAGSACVLPASICAMLTLAFAQIVWSIAFQWDSVDRRLERPRSASGPRRGSPAERRYYCVRADDRRWRAAFVRTRPHHPFGLALRGVRDSPLRAAAIGIDVARTQWRGFALAGAFAGLAGGLFAFSKGSISPESLAIPRSVDALVMVLLGGLNALFGPLLGAAVFTWLAGYARARHRILARAARRPDPAHRAGVSDRDRRACSNTSPTGCGDGRRQMNRAILQVTGLAKAFGGVRAVDRCLVCTLPPASCVALIGPNGAGKTTCFNLVNGQLVPDAGSDRARGATYRRRSAAGRSPGEGRPHVPGRGDVRLDDRARKRPARTTRPRRDSTASLLRLRRPHVADGASTRC